MTLKINRRSLLSLGAVAPLAVQTELKAQPPQSDQRVRPYRVRFAVASDGHYGQADTAYYQFHLEMIQWLNEEILGKGLDFVVFNGDIIHDLPDYLPEVKIHLDGLQCPYFVNKGNHDMATDQYWEQVWGREVNHVHTFKDYAFLFGTTSNEKGEYLCANTSWLEQQLKEHQDRPGIFSFFHISQYPFTWHAVTCPEVTSLLDKTPNVIAVFHGHDHDQDNVIHVNRHPYLFDGHMGGSWGTNYRGYRIVEIDYEGGVSSYQCNPAALIENRQRLTRD